MTPTMAKVREALEAAVKKIEPVLRPILIKAYRGHADSRFAEALIQAGDPEVGPEPAHKEEFGSYRHWTGNWHQWMEIDKAVVERLVKKGIVKSEYDFHRVRWGLIYKHPEAFKVTYKYADADANRAFENARESFVQKNFGKFDFVMGHRNDLVGIEINIGYVSGVFDGGVRVTLSNASFLCSIGLKYVLRTIPNVTPYYQYPLLFVEVVTKGRPTHRAPSEVEVRDLLGGGAPKTVAQIQEEKGLCPGSGRSITEDDEVYKRSRSRMSPYGKCPVCGEVVSAQNYKYRAHKTKAAQRSEAMSKGFCEMSDQPIPKEVSDAAIAAAVKRDYYGGRFILEKPFDSDVRFRCTVCKAKAGSASSRTGIYKKHKTK